MGAFQTVMSIRQTMNVETESVKEYYWFQIGFDMLSLLCLIGSMSYALKWQMPKVSLAVAACSALAQGIWFYSSLRRRSNGAGEEEVELAASQVPTGVIDFIVFAILMLMKGYFHPEKKED